MSDSGVIESRQTRKGIPVPTKSYKSNQVTVVHSKQKENKLNTLVNSDTDRDTAASVNAPLNLKDTVKGEKSTRVLKPKLSLQGPFRPSIVGNTRKHDDKRKRAESGARDSTFLSHVKSCEDLSPKRNQAQESNKAKNMCKVYFHSKPDTRFNKEDQANQKKPIEFKAATVRGPSGFRDLKKSKDALGLRVAELQRALTSLKEASTFEGNELKEQLCNAQERVTQLETDVSSLQEVATEKEALYATAMEEQAHGMSAKNKSLQLRVDDCIKKLQQCDIDPVSLESLAPDSQEQEHLEEVNKKSAAAAAELKAQMDEMNARSEAMIANMQEMLKNMKSTKQSMEPVEGTEKEDQPKEKA